MLTETDIKSRFTKAMTTARRHLLDDDLDNAVRHAAFASGLAAALDCDKRKALAAEILNELALLQDK